MTKLTHTLMTFQIGILIAMPALSSIIVVAGVAYTIQGELLGLVLAVVGLVNLYASTTSVVQLVLEASIFASRKDDIGKTLSKLDSALDKIKKDIDNATE